MDILTGKQIAMFIKENPNKYTYDELGKKLKCKKDRIYGVAKIFKMRDLVIKMTTRPRKEKRVYKHPSRSTNSLYFVKNRPDHEVKVKQAVEMIKNGDSLVLVGQKIGFKYPTVLKIVKEFNLKEYVTTDNQKIVRKLSELIKKKPNFYTTIDLSKILNQKRTKISELATKHNLKHLIKLQRTQKMEQNITLLESIDFTSKQDLIIKAKTLKITDQLIADKLDMTKQNVNAIKLRYQREILNSKTPSYNTSISN
jgi:TusA-related sulfurtransferase